MPPIPRSPTFQFVDYFDSDNPFANYEADWLDPPVLRNYFYPANTHPQQSPHPAIGPFDRLSNHSLTIERGGGPSGENCIKFLPATAICQACEIEQTLYPGLNDCGTPFSICDFGQLVVRFEEPIGSWYHVRAWIKVDGSFPLLDGMHPPQKNWAFDQSQPPDEPGSWQVALDGALAILFPKEPGYLGSGALEGPYGASGELLDWRPGVFLTIGGYYYNGSPALFLYYPGHADVVNLYEVFPFDDEAGGAWPIGEWVCAELAVGDVNPETGTGKIKLWINGVLLKDQEWGPELYYGLPGLGAPIGFAYGSMSQYGGLGTPAMPFPFLGTLLYNASFNERFTDRRYGMEARWARIATADGPIGCHTRGDVPPEETPDPDALLCKSADDYTGADVIAGECGRIICTTKGKTRESWETTGAGFSSAKSIWYAWTAPRSGNFIFRTRGSEVFNELSIHRHTGATPPPLVGRAVSDDWDPTASTSAAVEFAAEQGVEYRIRVASALDGWVVLDFGPPKHLVQDDGWSINDSERETRFRVDVVGTVSGLAVQDDQVAGSPTGAGTDPTMEPIVFGETA
jgi:hypothetical protein